MTQPPQQFQHASNSSVTLQPKRSRCAIFSLILGLLALPGIILCFTSVPLGIASLVLGVIGLAKIRGGGGRIRGTGMAWTGIVTSVLALVATVLYFSYFRQMAEELEKNPVEKTPLQVAEANVGNARQRVYYGNTPQAEALAKKYTETITELNATYFTREGRKSSLSLSGNKFATHCQLGEGTCAFIVHVPSYRKYTGDAKESLATLAWQAAQAIAMSEPDLVAPGSKLAVGLRGVILYGAVTTGTVAENFEADFSSLIVTSDENEFRLAPFFVKPEAADQPTPATGGGSQQDGSPQPEQPAADPFGS